MQNSESHMTEASQIPGATNHPEVRQLLLEMDALNAVLRVIKHAPDERAEAISLVQAALIHRGEPDDLPSALITIAMQKIVGTISPLVIHRPSTEFWDHYLADDTAIQWINWVTDNPVFLTTPTEPQELPVESAVHETVLVFWRRAVVQLAKGDLTEARRLFKRALDLGAQFGTESHVLVSWSYAASFLTEEA